MLNKAKELLGFRIHARDGEIGDVYDVLFDQEGWIARYLVVETALFLGRRVLISIGAVKGEPDSIAKEFHVDLTRDQVKNSPVVDTELPITRKVEKAVNDYYRWPLYWNTSMAAGYVVPVSPPVAVAEPEQATHLRSLREMTHYAIHASDGKLGHVEDLIVDPQGRVLYLIIDTKNWLPGKKVLIAVSWIKTISYADEEVTTDLSRSEIRRSPPYDQRVLLSREYEEDLYKYYDRPGYWNS